MDADQQRKRILSEGGGAASPPGRSGGLGAWSSPRANVGSDLHPIRRREAEEAARQRAAQFGGRAPTPPGGGGGLMRKMSAQLRGGLQRTFSTNGMGHRGQQSSGLDDWGEPPGGGGGGGAGGAPGGGAGMSRRMSQALFHKKENFDNLQRPSQMVFSEAVAFAPGVFLGQLACHLLAEPLLVAAPLVLALAGRRAAQNLGLLPARARRLEWLGTRIVLFGFIVAPIVLWGMWDGMVDQVGYMSLVVTLLLWAVRQTGLATGYAYLTDAQRREVLRTKLLTGEEARSFTLAGWLRQEPDTVEREVLGAMTRLKLHAVGGLYLAFQPQQRFKVAQVCLVDERGLAGAGAEALGSAFVLRSGEEGAARKARRQSRMFEDPAYAAAAARGGAQHRRKSRQASAAAGGGGSARRVVPTAGGGGLALLTGGNEGPAAAAAAGGEGEPLLGVRGGGGGGGCPDGAVVEVHHGQELKEDVEETSPHRTKVELKSPVKDDNVEFHRDQLAAAASNGPEVASPQLAQRGASLSGRSPKLTREDSPNLPGQVKEKLPVPENQTNKKASSSQLSSSSIEAKLLDPNRRRNHSIAHSESHNSDNQSDAEENSQTQLIPKNNELGNKEEEANASLSSNRAGGVPTGAGAGAAPAEPQPGGGGGGARPGSRGAGGAPPAGPGAASAAAAAGQRRPRSREEGGGAAARWAATPPPSRPVHVTSQDSRVAGAEQPLLCLNLEQIVRTLLNRQEAKTPWRSLRAAALCLAWAQAMLLPALRAQKVDDVWAYVPLLLFALGHVYLWYDLLINMISTYYDLKRRDWILSHVGKIMDSGLLVDSPMPQAENIYMWLAMRRIVAEFGLPFRKRVMVFTSVLLVFAWVSLVWLLALNLLLLRHDDDGFFLRGIDLESLAVILLDSLVVYCGLFLIAMLGSRVNARDGGHRAAVARQATRVQMRLLHWHPNLPKARSLLHKMEVLERVLVSVSESVTQEGEYYKIRILGMVTSEGIYIAILVLWGLTIAAAVSITLWE